MNASATNSNALCVVLSCSLWLSSGLDRCACEAQHALDIRQVQKQQPRKVGNFGSHGTSCSLWLLKHSGYRRMSIFMDIYVEWSWICIIETNKTINHMYIYVYTYIHNITLHSIPLHYIPLHVWLHYMYIYITCIITCIITLHYNTLQYITLHYIPYIHTYIHTHTHIHTYTHMEYTWINRWINK